MTEKIKQYPDGVYFNMPDEVYFKQHRLSSSGIQNLMVSSATFWASSWMNPNKEENDDLSDAQIAIREIGKFYHTARLEPEFLDERFIKAPDYDAMDGLLTNGTMVGNKLGEYGETKKRSGENVIQQAQRLIDCGFTGKIKCIIEQEFDEERGDRISISAKIWEEMERDVARIKKTPEIRELLTGGSAEVCILWTCQSSGIKMKAKIDYLKPNRVVDFKTYQNMGKELLRHIADSFRYNRYYIQGAVYFDAFEHVRLGHVTFAEGSEEQEALVKAIQAEQDPPRVYYVMQEKKGIPNLLAALYPVYARQIHQHAGIDEDEGEAISAQHDLKSGLFMKAEVEIAHMKQRFLRNIEVFPEGEEWTTDNPMIVLSDELFNGYWLDERL